MNLREDVHHCEQKVKSPPSQCDLQETHRASSVPDAQPPEVPLGKVLQARFQSENLVPSADSAQIFHC
jgi:hypothetical protein